MLLEIAWAVARVGSHLREDRIHPPFDDINLFYSARERSGQLQQSPNQLGGSSGGIRASRFVTRDEGNFSPRGGQTAVYSRSDRPSPSSPWSFLSIAGLLIALPTGGETVASRRSDRPSPCHRRSTGETMEWLTRRKLHLQCTLLDFIRTCVKASTSRATTSSAASNVLSTVSSARLTP